MFDFSGFEKKLRGYYAPLRIDLFSRVFQPEGTALDINDPIGAVLIKNGATYSGTQDLFPGFLPGGRVRTVTYRLRAMLTKKSGTPLEELGGMSYAGAARWVSKYPSFWKSLGLPGPLWFWGSAAILVAKGSDGYSVLLGAKNRDAVTFAGKWGPPAGIVEVGDFAYTLKDTLVNCAFRELGEETGAGEGLLDSLQVLGTHVLWEYARAKPQAFVVLESTPEVFLAIKNSKPREKEFTNLEGFQLSPEGLAAIAFM